MSLTTPPEPPRLNSSPQPSQPRPVNQKSTATATTTSTLESNNPPQRKRKRILQPLYEFRLKNPSPSPSHRPHTPHPPPQNSRDTQVLTRDEVDQKPWKYIGYKGYSDFISSENDFFILRKFSSVSARVALMLQDQVTVLEEKLEALDKMYSRKEAVDVNSGSFRDDQQDRVDVLEELKDKLMVYGQSPPR